MHDVAHNVQGTGVQYLASKKWNHTCYIVGLQKSKTHLRVDEESMTANQRVRPNPPIIEAGDMFTKAGKHDKREAAHQRKKAQTSANSVLLLQPN